MPDGNYVIIIQHIIIAVKGGVQNVKIIQLKHSYKCIVLPQLSKKNPKSVFLPCTDISLQAIDKCGPLLADLNFTLAPQ